MTAVPKSHRTGKPCSLAAGMPMKWPVFMSCRSALTSSRSAWLARWPHRPSTTVPGWQIAGRFWRWRRTLISCAFPWMARRSHRLYPDWGKVYWAEAARQGDRLVYSEFRRDVNVWRLDLTHPNKPPERFIASTFRDASPRYSPRRQPALVLLQSQRLVPNLDR